MSINFFVLTPSACNSNSFFVCHSQMTSEFSFCFFFFGGFHLLSMLFLAFVSS